MEIENRKLTRLETLIPYYNFWHKQKVAIEIDMAFEQRIALVGKTEDLLAKGKKMVEFDKKMERAMRYLSIIENLIKQENEKN